MKILETEVLVIGGGATGSGVIRDLAMRGIKAILVEKNDLTTGTTGRYHGLLHSGARYAVKDPLAAKECIAENRILRKIMPHCIEDTGGFFVQTPWDDPEYAARFLAGCQTAVIPIEEISPAQMLGEEPLLNPQITRCFRVPDGSADSFQATESNIKSARQYGAMMFNYTKVVSLIRERDRVVGAHCRDLYRDAGADIHASLVVNAAGAWAGKIASSANIEITIIGGKGTMIAANHRIVNTVINRCKLPSDGDILVPAHTVAVIGTTDIKVDDPDHYAIEPSEIRLLLEEGEKLIPGFKGMRMLRAWAGVRPLFQETNVTDNRDITRAFVLLDHEERNAVAGLVTITSGKWTTYRKMAEVTADLVCKKLGVQAVCRTHLEALPEAKSHGIHHLGTRLAEIEDNKSYGTLICECELATFSEVEHSILEGNALTIDDIRRDTRLGMGPCQGGFCTFRAAGILHQLRDLSVFQTNPALRDFLQERWKGLLPVLWGQQLRQERLDELIYLSVLNIDHLPGPTRTALSSLNYSLPSGDSRLSQQLEPRSYPDRPLSSPKPTNRQRDVLVIGAGLAGLVAAWQLSQRGLKVKLISKGWGTTHWNTGCIDVLGYLPSDPQKPVVNLEDSLKSFIDQNPLHPYSKVGLETIEDAMEALKTLSAQSGYALQGSIRSNWLLPTACGAIRPTCLAPETMIDGDVQRSDPMLIVGFEHYLDFFPGYIAANLQAQQILAESLILDLPSLRNRRFVTSRVIAELFETPNFRLELVKDLKPKLNHIPRIGLPAVLGLHDPLKIKAELENMLGVSVFEILTLPPSIAGIRIFNLLKSCIEKNGGRVYEGMQVTDADIAGKQILSVSTEAAARQSIHGARNFVLATGGFLGGGITSEFINENERVTREAVFNIPIKTPQQPSEWFQREFLAPGEHPIFQCGVEVNQDLQPVSTDGTVLLSNCYTVGNILAHCDGILRVAWMESL